MAHLSATTKTAQYRDSYRYGCTAAIFHCRARAAVDAVTEWIFGALPTGVQQRGAGVSRASAHRTANARVCALAASHAITPARSPRARGLHGDAADVPRWPAISPPCPRPRACPSTGCRPSSGACHRPARTDHKSGSQNDCAHRQAGAAGARTRHGPRVRCGCERAVRAHLTAAMEDACCGFVPMGSSTWCVIQPCCIRWLWRICAASNWPTLRPGWPHVSRP